MRARRIASTLATLGVLGGAGFAGYKTQDRWIPVVFPAGAGKAGGEGAHGGASAGADAHAGHDHGGDAHGAAGDRVKLSPQAQANLGLDVDQLVPQEYWRSLAVPALVVDRPGESDRGLVSRVAGVVTAIKARPGDTVRAGEPLFTIQLVGEFAQAAQADLAKAAKEREFAAAKRDRLAPVVRQGASPEASLIEEENNVKRFATQVQALRRQLLALGLTPAQLDRAEKGEVVTELTVAPVARSAEPATPAASPNEVPAEPVFEVQELKVQLGESVQAGQTLCLLASHQKLFVEGRAFKSEATALAKIAEQKVPVPAEFADEPPGEWPAQPPLLVRHLSNQVDPGTRTFAFYLPLDNQPRRYEQDGRTHLVWRYRPGQRVRLKVPVEKLGDEVYVLPAGAVVREGADSFAFVQNGDIFVRKPVRVLYEDRADVVVANDGSLPAAAFVVRNQAAALNRAVKAATGGGAADPHAGHNHDH